MTTGAVQAVAAADRDRGHGGHRAGAALPVVGMAERSGTQNCGEGVSSAQLYVLFPVPRHVNSVINTQIGSNLVERFRPVRRYPSQECVCVNKDRMNGAIQCC